MSGGPYAYAREVALRIAERPGATARELYRLFGDRFHEWNYDGSQAANVIAQHLSKFEEDGLVISEKKGKERFAPRTWTWVGPVPELVAEAAQNEPLAAARTAEPAVPEEPPQTFETSVVHDEILFPTVQLGPVYPLDAALIAVREAAISMMPMPISRREEKIACLLRLAEITAPDISALLNEIAEDLA